IFLKSPRDFYISGPALYVEPNQPIVEPYKYKLEDKDLRKLEPGDVFGIQIETLNPSGSANYTIIEAMVAANFGTGTLWSTTPKTNISLDIPSGITLLNESDFPKIEETTPAPTPNTEAPPH